jgi:phosphodiesterase/alkaline phosphatase D-like protein
MYSRRFLLKLTAVALPGLAIGCAGGFVPEDVPESLDRFPRTPIAGDMRPTRVVLAFFVADDAPVTLRMWRDEEVVVDESIAPSGDGFHKVMIDELTPGTTYHYAVFGGEGSRFEDRSLIGQVRTPAAEGDLRIVRFGLLSCVGQGTVLPDYYFPPETGSETEEPFQWELFTHAAQHDLDALVHLGDQAYLDFVWSRQEGTLEAYLNAWHYYHGGGYRDLYPLAGLYATWDDHESTDNGNFDPWSVTDEEAGKLANAQTAWYKVIPIDAMTPADGPVWRSFRWGSTVELILLDCRYELDGTRQVSPEQLDFLLDTIAASPCRFVCVATPKPFAEITTSSEFGADNADRWENFPSDRAQVTDLLDAEDAQHVIFVCGDIHMNYLGQLGIAASTPSERLWEVCTTSGNISPLASFLSDEQFTFVDNAPHLPVLTFDPEAGNVHVAFYGASGELSYEQTLTM